MLVIVIVLDLVIVLVLVLVLDAGPGVTGERKKRLVEDEYDNEYDNDIEDDYGHEHDPQSKLYFGKSIGTNLVWVA